MNKYFKNELMLIEFALLELSGKERNKILGVKDNYYYNKKQDVKEREEWINNILTVLEDETDSDIKNKCICVFNKLVKILNK